MSTVPLTVPVEEYLSTSYDPDCDYVDGELVDRNVGEKDHGKVQQEVLFFLRQRRRELGIFVIQEQRVRISANRYRVPDVCVIVGPEPDEQVFTQPPFLCIEVLSPEDRMSRMQERIADYLAFGVRYVWVIDPSTRKAWIYTPGQAREVADGMLRTENPDITVPLAEIFS
ncbi:MAG TPA: Uma2 family endonuclease [Verrucomicrobiae bacterium]|nr:Uma2 family endonuclease [Verrucomicrobiae bacterium]